MSTPNNYLESVRNEERRKRDEADAQTLRDQLTEIRQVVRELVSRQLRLEEQVRAGETELAKYRSQFEQHRHDIAQGAQARQLEESRVRQQLSDFSARIDDSTVEHLAAHGERQSTISKSLGDSVDVIRAEIERL